MLFRSRRLREELGIETPLWFTHRFRYQAQFDQHGAEHELCSVYVGQFDGAPTPNPREIADWQWIQPAELDSWLNETPEALTPWFKLEWADLRSGRHAKLLENIGLHWPRGSDQSLD